MRLRPRRRLGDDDPREGGPERGGPERIDQLVSEFNARFAVVNEGGRVWVFEVQRDPILRRDILIRQSFDDFHRRHSHRRLTVDWSNGGDATTRTLSEWWLRDARRRQFDDGVVFDPTGKAAGKGHWNLWRGYAVEPAAGDWSRLREHIEKVICAGDPRHFEYLLNWLARLFQLPNLTGEVAVVLRGKKGVGKGLLGRYVAKALGQHALQIFHSAQLVGRFNLHLRDCLFLFGDEAFYAGDRVHEGALKGLVTEPFLAIEAKFQNVVTAPNLLHIMLASNSEWVIPASNEERRYFVLEVADNRRGDRAYFAEIVRQMEEAGGLAAMLHELLHRDIAGFDVRELPASPALRRQQTLSLNSFERWLLAFLARGFVYRSRHGAKELTEWPEDGFFTNNLLHESYRQWLSENRPFDRRSREEMGKFLRPLYWRRRLAGPHILYEMESRGDARDPLRESLVCSGRDDRDWGYQLGSLDEARARFAEMYPGVITEWEEGDPYA